MSASDVSAVAPPLALSANRDFRWFWYGQAISALGDGFAMVALPLLVLDATNSVTQMGLVTALAAAGQIVMSLVAGLILDSTHRRRLMIGTDLARLLLYGSLPLAWGFHAHRLGLLYCVAFTGAALGNLFSVGHVAAVANLVERRQPGQANSRLQATTALAFVFGPMLAGAVCARLGTATALFVDAGSFAVSALSLSLVRFGREEPRSRAKSGGAFQGLFTDLLAGLRFVLADPVLRGLLAFMSAVGLLASAGIGAAVIDLFVYHLRNDLQQTSRVVGACLGVSALGALSGAILSPRVRRRYGISACMFGGTGLQAVGLMCSAALPLVAGTILAGALWAGGLTLRAVAQISLRQERAPDALLGRVTSASWTCIFGASSVGAVLVTHLAAAVGTAHAIGCIGVALGIVAVLGAASRFTSSVAH